MVTRLAYRMTGFVFLIVGILFFLRDLGINYIGNTNIVNIIIVMIGAGLVAGGGVDLSEASIKPAKKR